MAKALLSVYDKTGLVEFGQGLVELGWELLASGGTARMLREHHLQVVEVADYTGSPEILGGRVKTLHPAIHAGLLARPAEEDSNELMSMGWAFIDLAAVNLYPFEDTIARPAVSLEEAIENIDIGGVALIRAAAKNHERVTLVCDPKDYSSVLDELKAGGVSAKSRRKLAVRGFALTAHYDRAITDYLAGEKAFSLSGYPIQPLRYGENPHQNAAVFAYRPGEGPLGGTVLQGKELSYNNLLDLDAAWRTAVSFERPTICINKHLSPCGIASADHLVDAFTAALASDPVSAYGGVIASNRILDSETLEVIKGLFVECIIAPGFDRDARKGLEKKKNLRLVEMPDKEIWPGYEVRTINHGFVKQDIDRGDPQGTQWKVVTKRQPTEEEWLSLRFAWKACQFAKSNAIVFGRGEATVGIGSGQPNRVDCVHIAAQRAGERARRAVMASDAYFPFPDSIQAAAEYGITAVIQPGGSIRDDQSLEAADAAGMTMVITGVRHFRH